MLPAAICAFLAERDFYCLRSCFLGHLPHLPGKGPNSLRKSGRLGRRACQRNSFLYRIARSPGLWPRNGQLRKPATGMARLNRS